METAPVAAAPPANGVSVNAPTPVAAPVVAPAAAAPAPVAAPPTESWFKGFDWFKVLGYTVLVIVGVSYIKYARDKAKKESGEIADIKSQLAKISTELSDMQPSSN